jgi:hypothetical protein
VTLPARCAGHLEKGAVSMTGDKSGEGARRAFTGHCAIVRRTLQSWSSLFTQRSQGDTHQAEWTLALHAGPGMWRRIRLAGAPRIAPIALLIRSFKSRPFVRQGACTCRVGPIHKLSTSNATEYYQGY